MGNCLVTKLKATVEDSNLKKLGVFKIRVTELPQSIAYLVGGSSGGLVQPSKIITDGYYFTGGGGTAQDTTLLPGQGYGSVGMPAGTYEIEVRDKYSLQRLDLSSNSSRFTLDSNELQCLGSCVLFSFNYGNITGDANFIDGLNSEVYRISCIASSVVTNTSSLSKFTNLRILALSSDKVTGNFADIVNNCKLMEEMQLTGTSITGDASILLDENDEKTLPNCGFIRLPSGVTRTQELMTRLTAAGYNIA